MQALTHKTIENRQKILFQQSFQRMAAPQQQSACRRQSRQIRLPFFSPAGIGHASLLPEYRKIQGAFPRRDGGKSLPASGLLRHDRCCLPQGGGTPCQHQRNQQCRPSTLPTCAPFCFFGILLFHIRFSFAKAVRAAAGAGLSSPAAYHLGDDGSNELRCIFCLLQCVSIRSEF